MVSDHTMFVSLSEIADLFPGSGLDASFSGEYGVAGLRSATPSHISFFSGSVGYLRDLESTGASFCFVRKQDVSKLPKHVRPIVVEDPYSAVVMLLRRHYSAVGDLPSVGVPPSEEFPGAFIHMDAKIGSGVRIMPGVFIDSGVVIGDNVCIYPNVFIGRGCVIGKGVSVCSGATIENAVIGEGSMIRSGARIGGFGFGFTFENETMKHVMVPHVSRVIIGRDVDIGMNSCVDRGFLDPTEIGDNTKIDNLVQIGHGVVIGKSCILCGNVGVSGSAVIGDGVVIGGGSGVTNGIFIAKGVNIAAMSGVGRDIREEGVVVAGVPAFEIDLWRRSVVALKKLASVKFKNKAGDVLHGGG